MRHALKTLQHFATLDVITPATPQPAKTTQDRQYSDGDKWAQTHKLGLDQLDTQGVINWLQEADITAQ